MENYDLTGLEEAVISALKTGGVSAKIFANRPKSIPTQVNDFVVVSASGTLEDTACYGDIRLMVALFAKDVENIKNSKKLSVMYGKLCQYIPAATGKYLIDQEPSVVGDAPDDYGFHARVIYFNATIKNQ